MVGLDETTMSETGLSSEFFMEIIDLFIRYEGEYIIDKFKSIKAARERYLQENWIEIESDTEINVFRDVDFDYLIHLLRNEFKLGDNQLIQIYLELSNICLKFGEYRKCRDSLDYIKNESKLGQSDHYATYFMTKAKLFLLSNQRDKSEENYKKSLEYYKSLDQKDGMVKVYNNLGIISYEQKWDTNKGKEYFLKAKNIYEEDSMTNRNVELTISMNLAIIEDIQGNSAYAYQLYDEILNTYDDLDDELMFSVSINKAYAAKNNQDLDKALKSLTIFLNDYGTPSYRQYGIYKLLLAEIYIGQNKYNFAKENIIEAFKIFSKLHDRLVLADIYRVFGLYYRKQNDKKLAESHLKISLDINKEFSHLRNLSETHYEFSLLFRDLDDPVSRRVHLETALSYAESMGATKRAERLRNELDTLG